MRCRACNSVLSTEDLKRKCNDWDYCSHCRAKSMEEFDISDREYTCGAACGVQLDGTTLTIDNSYLSSDEY